MVAIIVEGKRDVTFFNNYIQRHLNIKKDTYKIIKTDGKSILLDESFNKYKDLKEEIELGRILKVLFIVDSDNPTDNPDIGGYDNSETSIKLLINSLDINNISDFFIACDPATKEGNIENLVISSLNKKIEECIKGFLKCSELGDEDGKRLLGIYNYGYPEKPYNFSHSNFKQLETTLLKLFS